MMEYQGIKIDEVGLELSTGQPMSFIGQRYGKPIDGIHLHLSVWGPEKKREMEHLFTKKVVTVQDPFTNRTYPASCQMVASDYQEGQTLHRYHHFKVNVMELETTPQVETLEIQGQPFKVVRYEEHGFDGRTGFSITALLHLTLEEFSQIKGYQALPTVNVRRVGTDEQPIELAWDTGLYWSQHETNSIPYYQQVVKLFPADKASLDVHNHHRNIPIEILDRLNLVLSARFQSLLTELVAKNVLTADKALEMMQEKPDQLLDATTYRDTLWSLDRVLDAGAVLTQ